VSFCELLCECHTGQILHCARCDAALHCRTLGQRSPLPPLGFSFPASLGIPSLSFTISPCLPVSESSRTPSTNAAHAPGQHAPDGGANGTGTPCARLSQLTVAEPPQPFSGMLPPPVFSCRGLQRRDSPRANLAVPRLLQPQQALRDCAPAQAQGALRGLQGSRGPLQGPGGAWGWLGKTLTCPHSPCRKGLREPGQRAGWQGPRAGLCCGCFFQILKAGAALSGALLGAQPAAPV